MIDTAVNQKIDQDLQTALAQGNQLRQIAGPFPKASTSIPSTSTQLNLRNWSQNGESISCSKRRKTTGNRQEKYQILHSSKNTAFLVGTWHECSGC